MATLTRRDRLMTGLGLVSAASGAALAAVGLQYPGAAAAGIAAFIVGIDFLARRNASRPIRAQMQMEKFVAQGRKLVIYERETGLFAHWYLQLRGAEECDRAKRYGRPLALLVIEPGRSQESWLAQDALRLWLASELRQSDITGYLGNGRYVVVMPEADGAASATVIGRLKAEGYATEIGLSCLPEDGDTYDALYKAAASQLPISLRQAA